MDFNEYQQKAKLTAIYPNVGQNYIYPTLGLIGEAGELANKIKKIGRDKNSELTDNYKQAIMEEMGDVLWYLAILADELGIGFSTVADENVKKLASRKNRNTLHGDGDNR